MNLEPALSTLPPALAAATGTATLAWLGARQHDLAGIARTGPWKQAALGLGGWLLLLALLWPRVLLADALPGMADALAGAAATALVLAVAAAWRRSRHTLATLLALAGAAPSWWLLQHDPVQALDHPELLPSLLAPALVPALAAVVLRRGRTQQRARAIALLLLGGLVGLAAGAGAAAPVGAGVWLLLPGLLGVGVLHERAWARRGGRPAAAAPAAPVTVVERALVGRADFERELERSLLAGQGFVLLRIEIDEADRLQAELGAGTTARLLDKVARRLVHLQRGDDRVTRLGEQAWGLLAHGVAERAAVEQLAQRVVAAVARPVVVGDRELRPACTVGSVTGPGGLDAQRMIGAAEQAVRQARRAQLRHRPFAADGDAGDQTDPELLQALREAIAGDALALQFQPKIDTRSGKVTAVEALLRWDHPVRGRIPPGVFVPVAERHGLMGPLGDWVVQAACRELRRWCDHGLRLRVAVNVSAEQMQQPDLARRLHAALQRHGVPAALLSCEITETAAMQDTGVAQQIFRELGEMGVHVSIDDFGTGYSSLAYLRRLPARELKIDRAFVTDLGQSADARAVVDAVVRLAHALGLKVVAEGVETVEQQRMLTELGCDELQGYLLARPMDGDGLLMWALNDRGHALAFADEVFAAPQGAAAGA